MGLTELLRRIRDVGVPEGMPPAEAKYIRMTNSWVAILMMVILAFTLFIQLTADQTNAANYFGYAAVAVLSGVIVLNYAGRHTLARVLFCMALYALLASLSVLLASGLRIYLLMIGLTAATILIFPKQENRLMWMMIGISVLLYHARLLWGGRLGAMVPAPGPERQIMLNTIFEYLLYVIVFFTAGVARIGSMRAEERLIAEQDKVNRLTAKLKVFLPRQFVDSLARGDRDVEPDYRRRRLTVFFSDVQGFTKWTDKLEPEEVREVLNHYLSEMSAIANQWGGTIDKVIGDCLMIFFGDPECTSDQDHALRCVKMALAMQERMRELREEWEGKGYHEPLHIRIGINSGWATVGNFGSEDRLNYTALGGAVNLASRLETASAPDKITISHTTYSLVKDEIECRPEGAIEVKGFAEPVRIYEVIGAKPTGTGS
ncbi:MAG TPA: adenylate/guanylate cyclase domain-containing protein [bacterium]|nr:adenylate/guanylate cyclase domain-containing protein [bacterium]